MSFPPARRLGPGDLKGCVALSVDRGWSPEQAKWSLLLAASEVFGVDAPDGPGLAGAVAARARTPVRLDLDPDRPELPGWAHAHGLEPSGRTLVMARGSLAPRGTPGRLFTPISVALA